MLYFRPMQHHLIFFLLALAVLTVCIVSRPSWAADGPLVSAGSNHTCGVRSDGTVACWGDDSYGQSSPPSGTFSQVSAGGVHTCGVRTGGTVACWARGVIGESSPPGGTFSQVSAGGVHTCGVRSDGTVACWGYDLQGQSSPPGGAFSQVSAGSNHTCGVRSDGTVACWGDDSYGQSSPPGGTFSQVSARGVHTCGVRTDGTVACWGDDSFGQSSPPDSTFAQVSAGAEHTCGVRTDGTVACWGDDSYGQSSLPGSTFVQVSAGGFHTCGVRSDGTVACWGYDDTGRFSLLEGGMFSQISAGSNHTCGVRIDSTLVCGGNDFYGQSSPPGGTFSQVSAGSKYTCGVRTDGTIACWGGGAFEPSPPDGTFTQVSAGGASCGVRTDGAVACWGNNAFGQSSPPSGTFSQVSASGEAHTCGVRTDGTVACWGDNSSGQSSPPDGTFSQVSVGRYYTCGVRTDGTVTCWGGGTNLYGHSSPPSGMFNQISVQSDYSCGLRTDNTVACWGFNGYGYVIVPEGLRSDPSLFQPPAISYDESRLLNVSTNGQTTGFGMRAGFIVQGQDQRFAVMGENMGGMRNPLLKLFNLSDNILIEQNDDWQSHPTASEVQSTLRMPSNSRDGAFAITLPQGQYYAELQDESGSGQGLVSVTATGANNFQQTYPINLSTRGPSPLTAGFIVDGDSARCFIVKAEGPHLGGNAIRDPALVVRRYDPAHPDGGEIVDSNNNWMDHPSAELVQIAGFAPANEREAALAVRLPQGQYLAELYSVFAVEEGGDSIVAVTELPEIFLEQASCDTAHITNAAPQVQTNDIKAVIQQPLSTSFNSLAYRVRYYAGRPIRYQGEVITEASGTPIYQWEFGDGAQLSAGNTTDARDGVVRYGIAGTKTVRLTVTVNGQSASDQVTINVLE